MAITSRMTMIAAILCFVFLLCILNILFPRFLYI